MQVGYLNITIETSIITATKKKIVNDNFAAHQVNVLAERVLVR